MSTRQLVYKMSRQPKWAQQLIEKMVDRIVDGKTILSISPDDMTAKKQIWLKSNGFEIRYNKKLHEWEIELTDIAL